MKGITVLLAMVTMSITVHTASIGLESKTCDVIPFQRALFNESYVLENRFDCNKPDDKLQPGDFCFHVYKCPLDLEEKDRHSSCICKSDGTWDFHYPTCEDLIPYALAVLRTLQKRSNSEPTEISVREDAMHGTNYQVVLKSSSIFVKPPMPKPKPTTTSLPTTTTAPTSTTRPTTKPEPKPERKSDRKANEKIKKLCRILLICSHLNERGGKCEDLEELTKKGKFFSTLCDICYRSDSCKRDVEMFG